MSFWPTALKVLLAWQAEARTATTSRGTSAGNRRRARVRGPLLFFSFVSSATSSVIRCWSRITGRWSSLELRLGAGQQAVGPPGGDTDRSGDHPPRLVLPGPPHHQGVAERPHPLRGRRHVLEHVASPARASKVRDVPGEHEGGGGQGDQVVDGEAALGPAPPQEPEGGGCRRGVRRQLERVDLMEEEGVGVFQCLHEVIPRHPAISTSPDSSASPAPLQGASCNNRLPVCSMVALPWGLCLGPCPSPCLTGKRPFRASRPRS